MQIQLFKYSSIIASNKPLLCTEHIIHFKIISCKIGFSWLKSFRTYIKLNIVEWNLEIKFHPKSHSTSPHHTFRSRRLNTFSQYWQFSFLVLFIWTLFVQWKVTVSMMIVLMIMIINLSLYSNIGSE